jgi:hypothetical protein
MGIFINADALAGITKLVVKDIGSAKKLECIARVRKVTGLGLREANDLVRPSSTRLRVSLGRFVASDVTREPRVTGRKKLRASPLCGSPSSVSRR